LALFKAQGPDVTIASVAQVAELPNHTAVLWRIDTTQDFYRRLKFTEFPKHLSLQEAIALVILVQKPGERFEVLPPRL
jgi:hypothetical protein